MNDRFDLKVLYGIKRLTGYKRYYFEKLLPFFKQKHSVRQSDCALTPPPAVTFDYPFVLGFSEESNAELMFQAYDVELKQLIDEGWKPDLIHAHCTVNGGIIAAFLSRKYQIPLIISEHQVFLLHIYSKSTRSRIFDALQSAQQVVAVSYHQMRCILMHYISCNPIVIGNYINEGLFSLKKIQKKEKFQILSITYPDFIKDIETLFKAVAKLIQYGHRDISLTIIGNNSFHNLAEANVDAFKQYAEKYNIVEYCNLISFVDRSELPHYYHNHDVFVSTSIAETFGIAICEALATGTPVVTTGSGGVDDTINSSNGIKVNIRDFEAVAAAIIRIKSGLIKFDPLIVRESIINKFGGTAFKSKLNDLYDETIATGISSAR